MTVDQTIELGNDPEGDPVFADDLEVLPGFPSWFAVSLRGKVTSPAHRGVALFRDGVKQDLITQTRSGSNRLVFGAAATTLYGLDDTSSDRNFQRFAVYANGIVVSDTTGYPLLGGEIKYGAGAIYAPSGYVVDAATRNLRGLFPRFADRLGLVACADAANNRAYFLTSPLGPGSPNLVIESFDATTFTRTGSVEAPTNAFESDLIRVGSNGLAIRTNFHIFVLTTDSLQATPPAPEPVVAGRINLAAKDLAYDPLRNKIYASIPGSEFVHGNSIAVINPATEAIESYLFVGSEPGKLALSDDAKFLYVSLDGAGSVVRVDLDTTMIDITFALGIDSQFFSGPFFVDDMDVVPGARNSLAVARRDRAGLGTVHKGVAIYDNGVSRPVISPSFVGNNIIEFGALPSRLYGFDRDSDLFPFRRLTVDSNGVVANDATTSIFSGFISDFKFAAGTLYATSGQAIDPEALTWLPISLSMPAISVRPDAANNRVYFLVAPLSDWRIESFDMATLTARGSLTGTDNTAARGSLIRWGADGLAFRAGSKIYLVRTGAIQ